MTELYVLNGPDVGKSIGFKEAGTYVGRAPECDLRLEDRTVSRRHLKITKRSNEYFVTDLNSRNGTLYDGAILPPGVVVPIREGEPIAIGMSVIGLWERCSERMAPVFELAWITTEIAAENGIFQVHRNRTNQKKLEFLYKVSRLLDAGLPANETLQKMLCYIFELLREVDTGAFVLVEPKSDKIMDVIFRTTEPSGDRSNVYCSDVVRQVIEERRPLVFSHVETEEEVDVISTLKIQKIQSVLCAPLISHSSAFAGKPAFMRGGMLLSSASADVDLDAGADEHAEALCEGGSCNGNHGFTRGAPYIRGAIYIDSRKRAFAFSKADVSLFMDLCKRIALFLAQAQGALESTILADSLHPDITQPS